MSAGTLEDTVQAAMWKVVAACDHLMRRTLHSRRTKQSGWETLGKYSAGDRRSAKRDPQRGDRGIPGDPP